MSHHKLFYLFLLKALKRNPGFHFSALITLIYMDWLPTGQWSAVGPTVCYRGSRFHVPTQFSRRWPEPGRGQGLFQMPSVVSGSCKWHMPSYNCLFTCHFTGLALSGACRRRRCFAPLTAPAQCCTCLLHDIFLTSSPYKTG